MQIHTIASIDKREPSDALAIPFFLDGVEANELPSRLKAIVQGPILAGDFKGQTHEIACVWGNEPEEKRLFLVGLGSKEKCSAESLRRAFGSLAKQCLKYKCKRLNLLVPPVDLLPHDLVVKALLEGLFLAGYVFDNLKNVSIKDDPPVRLEEIILISSEIHSTVKVAERTKKVLQAVYWARDLINGNADDINPQFLAAVAKEMSQEFPRITTHTYGKAWLESENLGLLLAVSRASVNEPAFIVCSYVGAPTSRDHTVLVGKGITYDTGGLCLKPPESMEVQKSDMSGAAVVLATIQAAASLGLSLNVTAVVPACENAIGSHAYKLGDVYKSRSGLTVEITNTDAEGRLILADALSYAVDELKPSRIIDIGTLTGAIEVALGNEVMGYFSNSEPFAEELWHSGQRTYERCWRLPLYEEYNDALSSDIADVKNAASRKKGGAIMCAMFLQKFVKDVPWAHFDIAGVAFSKEAVRYWSKNATGYGVRFLIDYLEHLAQKGE